MTEFLKSIIIRGFCTGHRKYILWKTRVYMYFIILLLKCLMLLFDLSTSMLKHGCVICILSYSQFTILIMKLAPKISKTYFESHRFTFTIVWRIFQMSEELYFEKWSMDFKINCITMRFSSSHPTSASPLHLFQRFSIYQLCGLLTLIIPPFLSTKVSTIATNQWTCIKFIK